MDKSFKTSESNLRMSHDKIFYEHRGRMIFLTEQKLFFFLFLKRMDRSKHSREILKTLERNSISLQIMKTEAYFSLFDLEVGLFEGREANCFVCVCECACVCCV
jgi:hypothetical protein